MNSGVVLSGLDGSNPLAFLAALGTLRLSASFQPNVRLHWRMEGEWHPVLTGVAGVEEEELCRRLAGADPIPDETLKILGKNLTVPPDVFELFVKTAERNLLETRDRRSADFAAALGSEVCVDSRKNRIEYTSFCFITGSGHQDFVETARVLVRNTKPEQIREALFGPWQCVDKGLSMRWDPSDAVEYALRWDNPGPLGVKSVWGASRLALEALPLFPAHPTRRGLATTGFREESDLEEFTWPIWDAPLGLDTVRTILSLAELRQKTPDRLTLQERGISEVFRSRRVRIGQGANFKVSFRPARSV